MYINCGFERILFVEVFVFKLSDAICYNVSFVIASGKECGWVVEIKQKFLERVGCFFWGFFDWCDMMSGLAYWKDWV